MEERTAQFHVDAQRPRDAIKTPKEVERLRKFLFKNQQHRFTEREQSHLFSAVQSHFSAYQDCRGDEGDPALQLLEDALKMPFTVFTTSHKKTFLKWHAKLTEEVGGGGGGTAGPRSAQLRAARKLQVIDVTDAAVSVMAADGDVTEVPCGACSPEVIEQVRQLFAEGQDVWVQLSADTLPAIIISAEAGAG